MRIARNSIIALAVLIVVVPSAAAQDRGPHTPALLAEYIETWANTRSLRPDVAFVRDCRNARRQLTEGDTNPASIACMTVHLTNVESVQRYFLPDLIEASPDLASFGVTRWRDGGVGVEYRQIRHTPTGRTFNVRLDMRWDFNYNGAWIAIVQPIARTTPPAGW